MPEKTTQLAEAILAELTSLADPKRAEGERRYFKGTINNLGVTVPRIRAAEKKLCRQLVNQWTVDDAMEFCDVLLDKRIFEVTLLALTFLERFAEHMGDDEFLRCEKWLENDLGDNWAAVDHLCPHTVGVIVRNYPHLAERVRTWADSPNRWLRRASAVTFILNLRKGAFLDAAYDVAGALFADKQDDLVQKGNGWMLREAGTTDPDRLADFLLKHGPNIPRTTLRYAIEKFPKDRRAHLLAATKHLNS